MTEWYDGIVTSVKNALDAVFVKKNSTSGLLKNDGTVDTNTYLTSSDLSNYVQKSQTNGLIKNNGTIEQRSFLPANQGSGNVGKFLKIDSNGDIICEAISFSGIDISVTTISGTANLNTYKTTGFYYITYNNANNISNLPPNTHEYDVALVVEGKADGIVRQTASYNESIYIRFYDDSEEAWSDWVNIRKPLEHTGSEYGIGTSSSHGHVKLFDDYDDSKGTASQGIGASSKAVADCYTTLNSNKQNKIALWYGNSQKTTAPTFEVYDNDFTLNIKRGTPVKTYIYVNGENICDLLDNASDVYVKYMIDDLVYRRYMNSDTKSCNININLNTGVHTIRIIAYDPYTIFLATDAIRINVVNDYS